MELDVTKLVDRIFESVEDRSYGAGVSARVFRYAAHWAIISEVNSVLLDKFMDGEIAMRFDDDGANLRFWRKSEVD